MTIHKTNREILLSAIRLEPIPRTPVITLSSGVWAAGRFGLSLQDLFTRPSGEMAECILSNVKGLDLDLVWTAADCNNIVLKALGAKTTFCVAGSASTVDEPLVGDISDIEGLNVENIENCPGIQNLLAVTRILKERAAGSYLIGVSQWGPLTLAGQMTGIERLMRLIVRDRQGINHLLDFAEQVILKYLGLFRQAGAELICISEPSASGDMISRRLFESTVLPHLQNVYHQIHADAKMLHICGNTRKILDLIPPTGADLFSFDYKVPVSAAAEVLGGKMAFAGQLDPVSVMLEGTPEDVRHAAEACIREAEGTDGYVLMPGCDVPPGTKSENVLAMVEAAHNSKGDNQ